MEKIKNLKGDVGIMKEQKKEKKIFTFKEKFDRGLITMDGFDLSDLNKKEILYFRMMYAKSGVLFLTSAPGIAKSAMQKELAKKIKKVELVYDENKELDFEKSGKIVASSFFYIDIRLAMLDETDVGLFPDKKEMVVTEQGREITRAFLDHIVPKWAYLANNPPRKKAKYDDNLPYCGTLIHFEELNRAPLAVRNAALQILLDRGIGFEFEFEDDVYMVSTGNLGEEDGTDVEEFDSALNGRLIHIEHKLDFKEWVEYFAKDNIQPIIVNYLTAHEDMYYLGKKSRSEKDKSYASPRTWTFLSDFITKNYGFNSSPTKWIDLLQIVGHGYIGSVNTNFLRYVRDVLKISIHDIVSRYPQIKSEGATFTRDKKSELLQDLRSIDFKKLKPNEIENVKLFMLDLGADEVSAFLLKLIDEDYDFEDDIKLDLEKNEFIISFLKDPRFKDIQTILVSHVSNEHVKDEKNPVENNFWDK